MSTMDLISKALAALEASDNPMTVEVVHELIEPRDVNEPLGISEAAECLAISAHTLRYYEKCGLINVDRDAYGHRQYDAAAVRRIVFLSRMRLSGMSMRDLQQYVDLVDRGDSTIPERLDILLEHRDSVRRRIRELQLSLVATEYKIETYGGATGP